MAAGNKFQPFVENLAEKIINLSGTLKVALTNTLPLTAQSVFDPGGVHPPPAAANGYPSGGAAVTVSASAQTGGTYKLTIVDVVFTATAGGIGPFRYAIFYDDGAAADQLIGWYDYGSSITLNVDETFTVDFDASAGVLTIA
jgi:hypothetical protein